MRGWQLGKPLSSLTHEIVCGFNASADPAPAAHRWRVVVEGILAMTLKGVVLRPLSIASQRRGRAFWMCCFSGLP
jgi:hypothetical protein